MPAQSRPRRIRATWQIEAYSMSLAGQRLDPARYTLVPRTIVFLFRGDEVLLIRLAADRGAWAGLLNAIGGHIEAGEDPARAARREILEETGLSAGFLHLTGVIMIDTGSRPGIGLYVFHGEALDGRLVNGREGLPGWYPLDGLTRLNLVEDLPILLPRVMAVRGGEPPFSAIYRYDAAGRLQVEFGP
jgi:8-oxo-dGTP diphosphatase